ncbi:MAG TPA: C-GCAxxG-C-C family protein [Anaeromyxobacter sp.]
MAVETKRPLALSRREILSGVGLCTLGAAAAGTLGRAWATGPAAPTRGPTEKWPWPYVKLDPGRSADLAYEEWYRLFCGGAVVSAVFSQLREKVGAPYTSFPIEAFQFLEGGIGGWGTICGANAGVNIVANVILGPKVAGSEEGMLMGSELMEHYASTSMPTYVPRAPRVKTDIPKTTARSPLCHVSVGRWMKAANKPLASPERRDRCARLTASMTYELVTLLNDWKDGRYKTRGVVPAKTYGIQAQHDCDDCHTSVPEPPKAM